ncbi:hypothetical protein C8P66_13151 [Humitalea rosea]|uniref:3-sulfinopropanoyl-CoA desulfinase n=1 Tax=Humitalea rosea TaxID=990373 RepID=A0A2W7HY85_9PROT|nr:3-sulfinopropanoyl-CoA desulfinase [Humitalea rosea]PZW39018.1 hypothetical protein C8P66_13151 [Humitalea rosea]
MTNDPALSPAERALRARAIEVAAEARAGAAEIDRTEAYPWPMVRRMTEAGLMGLTIPRAYGGQGASWMEAALVVEAMAAGCAVCGRIAVEANMGAIGAIMTYGTEAQKQIAARTVLSGDKPAILITEPEAGSAATGMATRAVRHGDTWVLDGEKTWITGGGVSRLHLIFARVIEDGQDQGIGGFIVVRDEPSDAPGLIIHRRIPTMGLRGMPEAEIHMRGLEVPDSMVLRGPGGWQRGFGRLMDAYNSQRVGAATAALGIAAGAFDEARDYALARRQFGRPIAEFQGLAWMVADMSIRVESARQMIWRAARMLGPDGFPDRMAAAQAKVIAADVGIEVTNQALQVWGGAGYSRDNPMERHVRDARMFAIAGGTGQVLRTQVAERIFGIRMPQTRDGWMRAEAAEQAVRAAAE